jgi:hypothetical protein
MRTSGILLVVAMVAAVNPAVAQRRGGDFVGGILGGATLSDFGGNFASNSHWGGTAGLFGAWRASRNSVGMLEVNWAQKGDDNTTLSYIELPLTFGAAVPTSGGGLLRLYVGIDAAFKVGCSTVALAVNCDQTKTPIWSVPFGLMVGRTSTNGVLTALDVRYDAALTDSFENQSSWNRAWYFRVILGKSRRAR